MSPNRPIPLVASLERIAEHAKGVPLSPDSRGAIAFQGSPSPARRGVKTTPKARLRHDDSQIQFAAIESSPLQPDPVESQYLTDRQKDVRERQDREAAAMFPEIRSSPRSNSRSTNYVLPKLVFNSTQIPAAKSAIDGGTSPTYLSDALMNEHLGSSPTPSSKRSSDQRLDDDPLSSPPFVSSHLQINQLTDAPLAYEDQAPMQVNANVGGHSGNHLAEESPPSTKGHLSNGKSTSAVKDAPRPTNDQESHLQFKEPHVHVDAPPMSNFDIYVDAPSMPPLNQPSTERNGNQANDLLSSFQSEESSHFSVEDDQVTAQLITEMERASSQQSAKPGETGLPAQGETKKRKRIGDSPNVVKKTKRMPASSDQQAASEIPRTGEVVADCVLIDVREADRSCPVLPKQIKRELSASPSVFRSTQAVDQTSVAQKRPADRLTKSEASPSSSQELDPPTTAKKATGRPRGSRSQVNIERAGNEQATAPRKSTRVSERLSESTTSSPHLSPAASQDSTKGGQWLAFGKTPGRGMFRWLQRSSAESEDLGTRPNLTPTTSSTTEGNAEAINEQSRARNLQRGDLSSANGHPEHHSPTRNEDHEFVAKQRDGEAQPEPSGVVETQGDVPSAQGLLQSYQNMLDKIKGVTFEPEEERAMVGLLFESVKAIHEAGRRHVSCTST